MVHYAPYKIGRIVKQHDGRRWVWRLLAEKAKEGAGSELFVWDDNGTLKVSREKK